MNSYYATRYAGAAGVVLGFHGCSRSVAHKVLHEGAALQDSTNDYDWLGHGKYFWEANPSRALQWAEEHCKNPSDGPAVIGACIDLTCCLNLLDSQCLLEVREAHAVYIEFCKDVKLSPPENSMSKNGFDMFHRRLDCAVINALHSVREVTKRPAYTSVRGVFWEGEDLYPNAGFKEKNHIQICVKDPKAILCYFHPLCYLKQNLCHP